MASSNSSQVDSTSRLVWGFYAMLSLGPRPLLKIKIQGVSRMLWIEHKSLPKIVDNIQITHEILGVFTYLYATL